MTAILLLFGYFGPYLHSPFVPVLNEPGNGFSILARCACASSPGHGASIHPEAFWVPSGLKYPTLWFPHIRSAFRQLANSLMLKSSPVPILTISIAEIIHQETTASARSSTCRNSPCRARTPEGDRAFPFPLRIVELPDMGRDTASARARIVVRAVKIRRHEEIKFVLYCSLKLWHILMPAILANRRRHSSLPGRRT
jgi:hypothetical protein